MTHGLLQRLAERALGVSQPLRAQRVQPASAGVLHEREIDAPTAVAPVHEQSRESHRAVTNVPATKVALPTPHTEQIEVEQPQVLVRAMTNPTDQPRAALPQRAPQRDESPSTASVVAHPAQPLLAPVTPARSTPLEPATKRPPLLLPEIETAPAMAGPALSSLPLSLPSPLLPEQPTLPVVSATGHNPTLTRHERITTRNAPAAERPTEVHVSIGRVELTALAPPPNAARPARTREPSRSLADYLRPAGKGKS